MTEIIFEKANEFILGYVLGGTILAMIAYGYVCIMAMIERNKKQSQINR